MLKAIKNIAAIVVLMNKALLSKVLMSMLLMGMLLMGVVITSPALISQSLADPTNNVAPENATIKDGEIQNPLTQKAGDPVQGKIWFSSRKLGNCLACHANQDLKELPFHGEIGPAMDGAADRYSAGQLRAILVNAKEVFGKQTVMPGFYRVNPGQRTAKKFKDKTILEGQQIEDIVAYLLTLKE